MFLNEFSQIRWTLYETKKPIELFYEFTVNNGDENNVTFKRIKPFPYNSRNDQAVDGLNYTIGGKDSCWGSGGPLWTRKKIGNDYFGYLVKRLLRVLFINNYIATLQVGIVSTGIGKGCGSLNSPS